MRLEALLVDEPAGLRIMFDGREIVYDNAQTSVGRAI